MSGIPANASKIRFNVTLEGSGLEFLKACMAKGYIEKPEDFFDRAGSFLEWGIKTIESGEQVASFNKDSMSVTVFDVVISSVPIAAPKVKEKKVSKLTLVVSNSKKE